MKTTIKDTVNAIIEAVESRGDQALVDFTRTFDSQSIKTGDIPVSRRDIDSSVKTLEPNIRQAIDQAAASISLFHRQELQRLKKTWTVKKSRGVVVGQIITPIDAVGIYVPGGRYSYPSTVLMTALCARVAGVRRIVVVTPPHNITPAVLYAVGISGVDELYRVGGAQAIAALAVGTRSIPRVDIIVGPGNAYVTEAKRQVYGRVGIDSLAGPSEVAIIADAGADPAHVAADAMAQMEHDPLARAFIFTDSAKIVGAVRRAVDKKYVSQLSITRCSIGRAVEMINTIAPEHVEILTAQPDAIVRRIRNAGAIFAGYATPTALGDYLAGPSHVLPTGGSARFASGLSASTFLKKTSYIKYSASATALQAQRAAALADSEGLCHHAASLRIRS
ncbi:MAG: histidinol dehydrogenase [Endomicrobiales bacterium]|jgi:histidinol dehydrogenase